MATEKIVLVFGGSGTIGSGIIKALLKSEKGLPPNGATCITLLTVAKIVSVVRTAEKLAAMKEKFGNLSEDKLLIVEGNVGELYWVLPTFSFN